MKKLVFAIAVLCISSLSLSAQQNTKDTLQQFILIVRYNPNMQQPSKEALADNIKHWNEFMDGLAQNSQVVSGYRPSPGGKTITAKAIADGAYSCNNESISSFIIIKATNMDAAEAIAKKCPVLEFDGSVEIRPLLMAN